MKLTRNISLLTGHRNEDLHVHHPLSPISRKESKASLGQRRSTSSMGGPTPSSSAARLGGPTPSSSAARLGDPTASSSASRLREVLAKGSDSTDAGPPTPTLLVTDIDIETKDEDKTPKKTPMVIICSLFLKNKFHKVCLGISVFAMFEVYNETGYRMTWTTNLRAQAYVHGCRLAGEGWATKTSSF